MTNMAPGLALLLSPAIHPCIGFRTLYCKTSFQQGSEPSFLSNWDQTSGQYWVSPLTLRCSIWGNIVTTKYQIRPDNAPPEPARDQVPELMPINIPLHNIGQDMDRARATSSEYSMPDLAMCNVTYRRFRKFPQNFKKLCPEILATLLYAVILVLYCSLRASEWKVKISDWNMNNIGPESNTINHSVCDLISYRVERFALSLKLKMK